MKSRLTIGGIVAGLLAACSLAPTYHAPVLQAVPEQYKEAGAWMPATPADTQPRGPWWNDFKDPQLDELERRLSQSNPDLQAALARYQQSHAISRQAFSALFPELDIGASVMRELPSANAPQEFPNPPTADVFTTGLNLAWEIDLFGRLRNQAAAAKARAQASAADLAALDLSLQAELATDYFSLRGADSVVQLLNDSIKQYDTAWEQTRHRYDTGTAAATDVDQADTLRQNARAQLSAVLLQRAQLEHAIAVLLGEPPAAFSLAPAPLTAEPPALDTGLSSTLLQRRPDVASAERTVAAANAGIGVARAAWFPVISLQSAAIGFESVATSDLFSRPSRYWGIGPGVDLPLLDAGGRAALNRQARAAYDETVANYRKTALTAYQEVEDALASLHHLGDAQQADEAAAKSATSAAYHADQRYAAGVADYIEVTTTHTAALSAESAVLQAHTARMNAAVALVRALGGGWNASQQQDTPRS